MKKALILLLSILGVQAAVTITNINVGTSANDGTGDTIRSMAQKINANFQAITNELTTFSTNSGVGKLDATNGVAVNLTANAITLSGTNLASTLGDLQDQVNTRGDAVKGVILGTNATIAPVAPYDSIATGSGNFGPSSGETSFEFINIGNIHRIRQSGEAIRAKIYLASKTGLASLRIKVWRANGSTYDLVNQSADILSSITAGSTNAITISIPSIKVGDYIGCRVTYSSASVQNFVNHLSTATTIYSVSDASPSSSAYAWTAQTATAGFAVPIELDMTSPAMVAIGDSIMAGHPNNYSFVETSAINLIESSIPAKVAEGLGLSYQNVAIGGQTMTNIAARFVQDVVALNPKWVLLQGGVNDIDLGDSEASFTNSLNYCITQAQAIGARVIYVAILPWSNGTTANHVTRAQFNSDARAIVAARGEYFVDAGSYVGQFRDGNAAGNIDDIQSAYNADGVHFTPLGYTQIAAGILEQFNGQNFDAITAGSVRVGNSSLQNGSLKTDKVRVGTSTITQTGVDSTRFGIGQTNGTSALTVKGGSAGSQNLFTIQNTTGTPIAYIYADSSQKGVLDLLDNTGAMMIRLRGSSTTNTLETLGDTSFGGTNRVNALEVTNRISLAGTNLQTTLSDLQTQINGAGTASNWSASGTTNSTLAGTAYVDSLVVTNGITAGSGEGGISLSDSTGTYHLDFAPNSAMTGDVHTIWPGAPFSGLAKWTASGTNMTMSQATAGTDYLTPSTAQTVVTNYFEFALGDETTAITTGTKVTWRAPFAFTIKDVRASLTTSSSSGAPAFNIKESGTTIFSTTLTIDASEKTSTTAATAYALSDSSIASDAEITFIVDTAGTGAAGAKIKIYYVRQ